MAPVNHGWNLRRAASDVSNSTYGTYRLERIILSDLNHIIIQSPPYHLFALLFNGVLQYCRERDSPPGLRVGVSAGSTFRPGRHHWQSKRNNACTPPFTQPTLELVFMLSVIFEVYMGVYPHLPIVHRTTRGLLPHPQWFPRS